MLGLILIIVVLACVLAYVPGIPPIGRTLITIAIIVLCVLLLFDVLGGGLGPMFGRGGRLFSC